MQTLAIVSKSTKQGLSVWRFVSTENGEFFAFGGCKPACKRFTNLNALRSCYRQWVKYGYEPGLVPTPSPVKKQVFLSDPWATELPAALQLELEALTA